MSKASRRNRASRSSPPTAAPASTGISSPPPGYVVDPQLTLGDVLKRAQGEGDLRVFDVPRMDTALESVGRFHRAVEQCAAAGAAAGVLVTMAGVGIVVRNAAGERVRGRGGPPTLYVAMAEPNVLYAVLDDEVVAVNRVV